VLRKARIDAFHNRGIDKIYDLSGSGMEFAVLLKLSQPAVSLSFKRGEKKSQNKINIHFSS
jgi:predicted transcriptional regulator